MHCLSLIFAAIIPTALGAETLLGLFVLSRHGDRTPKSLPPSNLTTLGYSQVYESGTYYRNRYVASNATNRIAGLNDDVVKLSQLAVSAPQDNVLQSSAQAFLQALYPPVGTDSSSEKLRNGTNIEAPLNGYQLIPISTISSGSGSEDSTWLQGAGNCAKAQVSSNAYMESDDYTTLMSSTTGFYKSLAPVTADVFPDSDLTFKNAYAIFDLLNVALIHNSTLNTTLLPPPTITRLQDLANQHEYNLAYNSSDTVRAIAGAVLAGEILTSLSQLLTSPSKSPKLTIQFNAYATSLSFFGLADLPAADPAFTGIPDYASNMAFELFTTAAPPPSGQTYDEADVSVRFLWNNGSSAPDRELVPYPLFGGRETDLKFADFRSGMQKFAVSGEADWCKACGNSTGVCAATGAGGPDAASAQDQGAGKGGGGVSKPVAGVIGAMVTLAVVLGLEALVLLLAGLRVVRKSRGGAVASGVGNGVGKNEGGAAS